MNTSHIPYFQMNGTILETNGGCIDLDGISKPTVALIFSAPDLLAALEQACKWLECFSADVFTAQSMVDIRNDLKSARAAISKAKGHPMNTSHTPGPWYATGPNVQIVRSVNCHEDLLNALQALLSLCECEMPGIWKGEGAWEEAKSARAAISKAKGQP